MVWACRIVFSNYDSFGCDVKAGDCGRSDLAALNAYSLSQRMDALLCQSPALPRWVASEHGGFLAIPCRAGRPLAAQMCGKKVVQDCYRQKLSLIEVST